MEFRKQCNGALKKIFKKGKKKVRMTLTGKKNEKLPDGKQVLQNDAKSVQCNFKLLATL